MVVSVTDPTATPSDLALIRLQQLYSRANITIPDQYTISVFDDGSASVFIPYKDRAVLGSHRVALSSANLLVHYAFNANDILIRFSNTQLVDGIFDAPTSISDKIQKLLALSTSPNEHEARAAALKAQELMSQFGIQNDSLNSEPSDVAVCVLRFDFFKYKQAERKLVVCTASSYRCRNIAYANDNTLTHMELIGTKTDLYVYNSVLNYLVVTMWQRARYMSKPTDYCEGFIAGVASVLAEQCVALALVVPKVVDDYVSSNYTKLKYSHLSPKQIRSSSSFIHGFQDGESSMKSRQIEGE